MSRVLDDEKSSLTVVEPPVAKATKWSRCCQVIRDEFRLKNFCFDFDNEKVFYSSQWRLPRLVFVILRVCLAVYTAAICLLTISYFPRENTHRSWLSFHTNWSYFIFACHQIVSATIAVLHVKDSTTGLCCMEVDDNENEDNEANGFVTSDSIIVGTGKSVSPKSGRSLPCYIKFSWFLFSVACPMAIIVVIFTNVGRAPHSHISFKDFNNHILNGIIAVLEVCIAAIPVRLLHIVYVVLFISIYFLFNYVFWSFDHTWNIIYPYMDWENPGEAILPWVQQTLIYAPIIQIMLFTMYRLRVFIYSKIFDHEHDEYDKI